MSPQSDDQKKQWNVSGSAISAGLSCGINIGFLVDNVSAGICPISTLSQLVEIISKFDTVVTFN
jgi:hypothetical protein